MLTVAKRLKPREKVFDVSANVKQRSVEMRIRPHIRLCGAVFTNS